MTNEKAMLSSGRMTQALWKGALRQGIALSLCATILPLTQLSLMAQDGPPPQQQYPYQDPGDPGQQGPPPQDGGQQQAYIPQGPQELEQLVAPIALYPDSLVAQTLAASTYPQQVQEAEGWMQQYGNQPPEELAQAVNQMPWDPSVKALTQFPQVLEMLARGQQWTIALGNAYYNQPADVMGAVQSMRYRAREAGQLRDTAQQVIEEDGPQIIIQPANPEVVYVPYYDPWTCYGEPINPYVGFYRPPPPRGFALGIGIGIGFGIGVGLLAFGHYGWGYHAWAPNWRSNTIIVNHNTYISRSTTVYNRGNFGAYNQGFNHGGPQNFRNASFNRNAPMYNGRPMGANNRPPAGNFNRPGGNAGGFNRPGGAPGGGFNRPGGNSGGNPGGFNRPGTPGNNGNFNRPGATPGNMVRPAQPGNNGNFNRPGSTPGNMTRPAQPGNNGNFNRPGGTPGANPGSFNRPGSSGTTNGYNRPSGTAGAYSRPSGTAGAYNRPAPSGGSARPQAQPAPRAGGGAAPRAQHEGGGEHHGSEHKH